jgi:NAD(P)-dependent dehydrogenase (short-subunit alcohol dehydrogenase family)
VSTRHNGARSQRPAALVTGGGRGIGRLLARRLADAGYAVGLISRSPDELAETCRLVEAAGGRAAAFTADVTDAEAAPDVMRQLETELGPTELMVNNAGILGPIGPAWEVDLQSWWRTLEVNLFGTVVYTRLALASMVERGRGRVINITSQAGAFRWPIVSAYSVSKAATIKLTENVAIEARRHGVSIFSIHPGLLPIGLTEGAFGDGVRPESYEAGVYAWAQRELAEGRGADPDRAVDQMLRLASGRYDALSGRHLSVHDDLDVVLAGVDDRQGRDLYFLSEILPRQRGRVLAAG